MYKNISCLLAALFLMALNINAQTITPTVQSTQGGYFTGAGRQLEWTIGQPIDTTYKTGGYELSIGFLQPEIGQPTKPAPQTVCSDTPYIFTLYDTAGIGAQQIEWSTDSSFAYSTIVNSPANISITVNGGSSYTVWLRSRDSISHTVSGAVTTLLKVNWKPLPPTPPAPQAVNSASAYTFHFLNLNPGYHGNRLAWALDSNFTTTHYMACFDTTINGKDTSSCTISVTVSSNSDTLIWLKSIDSASGCASNGTSTIAIVNHIYQRVPLVLDTIITICAGSSTNIPIPHSRDTLRYSLRIDTTVISSSIGNNATLYLNTDTVNSGTIFNILTTDTATGDTATLGFGILVQALAPVDTNVLITGDTFVYMHDTICYIALANNSIKALYSITGGSASVDSITGCVTGITSNFTVHATVYGAAGCGTASGSKAITATNIAAPVAPAPVKVYIDSPTQVTLITFSSIAAGSGGDEIEWAGNKNFTSSHLATAPANIYITLTGLKDSAIWLRSVDSKSGNHSGTVKSLASTAWPTLSAGLLDKSHWQLDTTNSDEFNYGVNAPGNPSVSYPDDRYMKNNTNFLNKWNLIFGWDTAQAKYATDSGAYWLAGNDNESVSDWGESPQNPNPCHSGHGCGHEVGFTSDGVALFTATKLDSIHHLTNIYFKWTSDSTGYIDTARMSATYQSGMLASRHGFPVTNSMFEFRAILPNHYYGVGHLDERVAFWNYTGQGDYTIIDGGYADMINNAVGDYNDTGCNQQMIKITPCNYAEDWHTYAVVASPTEVISFINGKETWSTKFSNVDSANKRWPGDIFYGSTAFNPILLGLGAAMGDVIPDSTYPQSFQLKVDYFRYYTPKSPLDTTNPAAQILQNPLDGAPQTLETLYNDSLLPYNTPPSNNNPVLISNTRTHTSAVLAQSKIAYDITGQEKIFYAGADGRLYNTYWNGSSWVEYDLTNNGAQVTDVWGGVTADTDRVFYYDNNFKINFFQYMQSGGINQWVKFTTGATGFGPLNIDRFHRVFYVASDGNVYAWCPNSPTTGTVVQITFDGNAQNDLVVAQCGCLMFYRDKSLNLVQQSWWGSWRNQGVVAMEIAPAMVMDETNSVLYFIDNNDVYAYKWDYNNLNPAGLKELGANWCSLYANAEAEFNPPNPYISSYMDNTLALSNNKNMIYYWDGNYISYYYNDMDRDPTKVNWYRTPLDYTFSNGLMAVEPWGSGRLFYNNDSYGDEKLYYIQWENADNPLHCPRAPLNYNHGMAAAKMYSIPDTTTMHTIIDSTADLSVRVFPNPSKGTFTFIVTGTAGNVDIKVYDINGSIMGEIKGDIQTGLARNLIWDAREISGGIYYYKTEAGNKQNCTGKLVKM